jgi:hypothetical protein
MVAILTILFGHLTILTTIFANTKWLFFEFIIFTKLGLWHETILKCFSKLIKIDPIFHEETSFHPNAQFDFHCQWCLSWWTLSCFFSNILKFHQVVFLWYSLEQTRMLFVRFSFKFILCYYFNIVLSMWLFFHLKS